MAEDLPKKFQIQCLADGMVDIADGRAGEGIERQGLDGNMVGVTIITKVRFP
jgi:hypothetical protein